MKIPQEIQEKTIELYTSGKTSAEIAAVLPISTGSVFNILKKYGVKSRGMGLHIRSNFFDQGCFSSLNEESAYWLGFVFADGCMRNDNYSLTISLSSKDKPHLEKFAKFLGGRTLVRDISVKQHKCCRLSVGSKQMFNDLLKYGCTPKKSLTLKWPDIPDEYLWHFLRGYFDGDGCAVKQSNRIDIVSSYEFIDKMGDSLTKKGFRCKYRIHGKVKYLIIHGIVQLREFTKLLYKDASVFLERKKEILDSKKQISQSEIQQQQMEMVQSLRGHSYKEIVEKTGFSHNRVHHLIKCLNKREKHIRLGDE